jgi:hypothetical protein
MSRSILLSAMFNPLSLFIPRVFANIGEDRIKRVFDSCGLGLVDRVDFVSKMDAKGQVYNSAYIHFKYWYNTASASNFVERVRNPNQEARVVYDDPWYWIVLENTGKRHGPGSRKQNINLSPAVAAYEDPYTYDQLPPAPELVLPNENYQYGPSTYTMDLGMRQKLEYLEAENLALMDYIEQLEDARDAAAHNNQVPIHYNQVEFESQEV